MNPDQEDAEKDDDEVLSDQEQEIEVTPEQLTKFKRAVDEHFELSVLGRGAERK